VGPLSSKLLFAPRDCLLDQGELFQPPPVCDIRPYRAPSQFGYFDLLLFIARFLLLDNCSQLRLIDDALPLVDIAGTASAGVGALSQVAGLVGFCTRARTWDPLIKRHASSVDISSEFSQLTQNASIRDQWLTAKNPTMHPRRRGFEASFDWDRVQLCQLIERQLRFPIRQGEPHNNVLTAKLAPQRIRRPLLRLRSAQTLDPNKVPLRHKKRSKSRTLRRCRWFAGPQHPILANTSRVITLAALHPPAQRRRYERAHPRGVSFPHRDDTVTEQPTVPSSGSPICNRRQ